jgi:DNA-binding transcriptional LysR family regulator
LSKAGVCHIIWFGHIETTRGARVREAERGGGYVNSTQIKCFLAAAEHLSFTRAADDLFLSQSVLSRHIASMERELGVEMFVRAKNTVKLTPAGQLLAGGLRSLAREYRSLTERALALHLGFEGSLNVGILEGQLLCPPFSPALKRFREERPSVRLSLSRHSMASMRSALLSGEIDVGFDALFNVINHGEFEYIEVGRARTLLVIPKTHPLAGRENLRIADFKDDTFLRLSENETTFVNAVSGVSAATGRDFLPKTLEAPTIGALALWLEAGFGIFPLNENHSLRNNPNLLFVDIPELVDTIEVVVWKKGGGNPAIPMFVDMFARA